MNPKNGPGKKWVKSRSHFLLCSEIAQHKTWHNVTIKVIYFMKILKCFFAFYIWKRNLLIKMLFRVKNHRIDRSMFCAIYFEDCNYSKNILNKWMISVTKWYSVKIFMNILWFIKNVFDSIKIIFMQNTVFNR